MIFLDFTFGNFFNAHQIIEICGLFLVLAVMYIETGFFHGFKLLGGDYMLFAAGVFFDTHYLNISLFGPVVLLIAASFPGYFTIYFKRKWLGGIFFTDNKSRFFKKDYFGRRNGFYNRYGIRDFNMRWFMAVIFTSVPMIAQYNSWQLRKNLILNQAGPKVMIGSPVSLQYCFGRSYRQIIKYSARVPVGFILIAYILIFQILILTK